MKKIGFFLCFLSFVVLITPVISSAEEQDLLKNSEQTVGYASFLDAIPDEIRDLAEACGVNFEADAPSPTFSLFFSVVLSLFFDGVVANFSLISIGLILIVMFKLLSVLTPESGSSVEALGFLAVLSSGIYSFSVIEKMLSSLTSVSSQASSFFAAALPVITSSQVLAGETERSFMVASTLPLILFVISTCITSVFYPLCWFCYAAALLGFTHSSVSLRPLVLSIKKFCVRGVEILSGLAVGVFCIQRVSSGVADSLARKSAKFAFARLMPLAGGTLSDGLETVYACGQSIRGKVGIICVLVLLGLFAVPCLSGLIFMFLYSFLSAVSGVFGVPVLTDFFSEVKDTFSMMTCFSLCSMIVLASGLLILLGG